MDSVTLWHDDGHVLTLRLDRSLLVVDEVACPNEGGDPEAECFHPDAGCVVDGFLARYGLDCHVGVCPPHQRLRVAWTMVGDGRDLDAAQVWVISTEDEAFAAWLVTQTGGVAPEASETA